MGTDRWGGEHSALRRSHDAWTLGSHLGNPQPAGFPELKDDLEMLGHEVLGRSLLPARWPSQLLGVVAKSEAPAEGLMEGDGNVEEGSEERSRQSGEAWLGQ